MSYIRYDWTAFKASIPALTATLTAMAQMPPFPPTTARPRPMRRCRRRPRSARCTSRSRADPAEPAGGRMEAGRGHPQRDGPGRALPGEPGHGAQGHRRAGRGKPGGAPPGQGHLRRDPCRAARAVPLPQADARQRRPRQRRPGRSARCSSASACAPRPRWRARWRCASGDPVVQVRRVLSFGGVPTILEDLWLPGNAFKGLTADQAGRLPRPHLRACSRSSSACAWCAPRKRSAPCCRRAAGRAAEGGAGRRRC